METNNNVDIYVYVCEICNKSYKNRDGLWKHNKKYHRNDHNHSIPIPNQNLETYNHIYNPNIINNSLHENIVNYNCNKCNKNFTCYQNRWRHQKSCKFIIEDKKDNLVDENNKLKLIIEKQSEENQEIKKTLMELLNKNCKVHPKTLQKINKQLNLNGDHNTINNGIINNTYNLIALGHENLTDVFSRKEKMAILKYRYCSLPHLVEYTHFNDKYPQFKNILITNTQNTLAYKFDIKKKQFITVDKNDLLEDIIDERMCDLNSFFDELENDLDEKTKEIIEIVKEKIDNDPAYKELKKKDIKLIIYNNRKKVNKDITDDLEIEV